MVIKHILIVKPSSLGDVINTFPAVNLISTLFPECTFDWLIHPAFISALDYSPSTATPIIFPRKQLASLTAFAPAFFGLVRELRGKKYDLVIDFQGLLRSALFAKFTRNNGIAGFARPKERIATFFYDRKIEVPPDIVHAVDRNLCLAASATETELVKSDFRLPKIKKYIDAVDIMFNENLIDKNSVCVGIIPGARWSTKRWPPEFFADVIKNIGPTPDNTKFLIIGDQSEVPCAEKIIHLAGHDQQIISFAGKTDIGELIEVIRRCRFVVTNDSGPMHIAAAHGLPVFALFGPTDPEKTGPYGNRHHIFQPNLDCIKCLKKTCHKPGKRCQNTIDPSEVAKKISTTILEAKHE